MGRLPGLWLQKAVSVFENFPEGCLKHLTWPSALLRKTVLHIPYVSKRRRKVLKKERYTFFFKENSVQSFFPQKGKRGRT